MKPAFLPIDQARAFTLTLKIMTDRGWKNVTPNWDESSVEATDVVSLFRFKDDIVVRIRPAPGGSRVDVRSVSRVGVSDLGVNAVRVRDFLDDLRAVGGGGS